jgi:hypothetical protein
LKSEQIQSSERSNQERVAYYPKSKFDNRNDWKKLIAIQGRKNAKEGFRPVGHRSVELQLAFCLQQNLDKGGGVQKSLLDDQRF